MYASFIVSYIVRIIIILTLISSSGTCAKKQNYTEEHDPSTEISKRNEQHFIRPKNNETNVETSKTIQTFTNNDTHSESTKNRLSNFGTRGNESFHVDLTYVTTEETMRHLIPSRVTNSSGKNGVIRRKKRCILAMMAMGGVAVAGSMLRPPRRRRPTPPPPPPPPKTTTTKKPTTTTTTTTEEPTTTTTTKKPTTTTTTTTTKKPTTTTTKKPTTTTTEKPTPTTTTRKPTTPEPTTLKPTTTTTKKPAPMTTPATTTPKSSATTTPSSQTKTTTPSIILPPISPSVPHMPGKASRGKIDIGGGKDSGTIVIEGFPKYDVKNAIIVMKFVKKTLYAGILIIEFVHPITNEIIQVPWKGGDEYVNPVTRDVYIIFVDSTGKTLLIRKGPESSIYPKQSFGNNTIPDVQFLYNINITLIVEKYKKISIQKRWGSLVIAGRPKYDLSRAIIIMKREKRIDSDGILFLQFVHPVTGQKIRVPFEGGDEYVEIKTLRVFVIFVDAQGQTLLIFKSTDRSVSPEQTSVNEIYSGNNNININENVNVIEKRNEKISRDKKWGSLVIAGIPKYDISSAIIVTRCEKKIDNNGILVIEFFHPITDEQIQVPFEVGDEYVEPETRRVFVIFVDARGRTLLIFKGMDRSVSATQWPLDNLLSAENNINENTNDNVIEKYQKISKQKNWGSIVIYGIPKYDISSAMLIEKTVKKIGEDGIMILEFQHPVSGQKIRVPLNGGDEYVNPKTLRVYIIFVDIRGQTLLIFKGMDRSVPETQWPSDNVLPAENNINENTNENVIEKYKQISKRKNWGSIVIDGLPKYDILRAILIEKTVKKIGEDGITMLEFEHPVSGRKIRVPLSGGDEYVNPKTLRVYIIFVDIRGRTLLIFKGMDRSVSAPQWPSNNVLPPTGNNIDDNTNEKVIEKYEEISKQKNWGSIVIDGVPKYDISSALVVTKTVEKIGEDGISKIEFLHPITGQKIQIPLRGGDEYVKPGTSQVFVIFVDVQGRTLLIFKGTNRSIASTTSPNDDMSYEMNNVNNNTNVNVIVEKYREMTRQKNWGSLVVDGIPNYDISSAIFVKETKKKYGKDGILMIQFNHPITRERIFVPWRGGDEYVKPITGQVYVIFVDVEDRTLLIFKGERRSMRDKPSIESVTSFDETTDRTIEEVESSKIDNSLGANERGSIVVNGYPRYDISRAIYVTITKKIVSINGISMLEFEHPVTGWKIRVSPRGGDEYVEPKTRRVFVIFVDTQGRTILILRDKNSSLAPQDSRFDKTRYGIIDREKKSGTIVVNGFPEYDVSRAIYVMKKMEKINNYGIRVIEFVHPITLEKIEINGNKADEYVEPGTQRLFIIFVDVQGRTLLIFKGFGSEIASKEPATIIDDDDNHSAENINVNRNINENVVMPRS